MTQPTQYSGISGANWEALPFDLAPPTKKMSPLNLQTMDRKIAERKLKKRLEDVDKINSEAEKPVFPTALSDRHT
jgi:hypothetical protein